MGIITLASLIALELVLFIWSITTKNDHKEERGIIRLGTLAIFVLLLATGVYVWSFRYMALSLMLGIQAFRGVLALVRKSEGSYRTRTTVLRFIRTSCIIGFALFPAIVFPQYQQPITPGTYEVGTEKYTWTDPNRIDEFSKAGENRALTVEFWYPKGTNERFPLVVFSHGAFGFSGSNLSTFLTLASRGYVVASIAHTSHAFYTLDTQGKLTIVDKTFIAEVNKSSAATDRSNEEEMYSTIKKWMKLRTEDENFVLDTILGESQKIDPALPFSLINKDKIGLMGHSLGGASSAQLGRERTDIDAVIVIDGTMLGEEVAYVDNALVINDKPFPVPLLNIYAEDHYTNAKKLIGDTYGNFHATANALLAYETVIRNSGHLNFTDLPLFSPLLAKLLGVGLVNKWYCIEMMNEVVVGFFNSFLKDAGEPDIAKEY